MERHEEMLSPEEQYAQLAPTLDADGFSLYAAAEEVTGLKVYALSGIRRSSRSCGKMTSQRLLTWRHSNNAQRKRWAD